MMVDFNFFNFFTIGVIVAMWYFAYRYAKRKIVGGASNA